MTATRAERLRDAERLLNIAKIAVQVAFDYPYAPLDHAAKVAQEALDIIDSMRADDARAARKTPESDRRG